MCCIMADINLVDLHWTQMSQHSHHATLPRPQSSQMPTTQHSLNSRSNARQFKLFIHDGLKKTRLLKTCLSPTWAWILLRWLHHHQHHRPNITLTQLLPLNGVKMRILMTGSDHIHCSSFRSQMKL